VRWRVAASSSGAPPVELFYIFGAPEAEQTTIKQIAAKSIYFMLERRLRALPCLAFFFVRLMPGGRK
jgi:hypothetical protein